MKKSIKNLATKGIKNTNTVKGGNRQIDDLIMNPGGKFRA